MFGADDKNAHTEAKTCDNAVYSIFQNALGENLAKHFWHAQELVRSPFGCLVDGINLNGVLKSKLFGEQQEAPVLSINSL